MKQPTRSTSIVIDRGLKQWKKTTNTPEDKSLFALEVGWVCGTGMQLENVNCFLLL